jgi:hypothetical protein
MNCDEVQKCLDQLMAHRDTGQLSPQALEHLKECAACRAKMQVAKETIQLLTHMPRITPKPEFSGAWQKQIRQAVGARPKWKSFFDFMHYSSIRPVLGAVILVTVSSMVYQFFYSAAGTNYRLAKAAPLHKQEQTALPADFKVVKVAVAKESYELKIIAMGAKSREVRQLIQNYRLSRAVGVAPNLRQPRKTGSVLNGLKRDEAQALQKELERVGAIVKIAPE